jgi:hypothetical protein
MRSMHAAHTRVPGTDSRHCGHAKSPQRVHGTLREVAGCRGHAFMSSRGVSWTGTGRRASLDRARRETTDPQGPKPQASSCSAHVS